jgi:ATP-dependent exoDNAse (exonuclease V) beta subunit
MRRRLEEAAEEARLLYVATTRARDRLILVGGGKSGSFGAWLAQAKDLLTTDMQTGAPPAAVAATIDPIDLAWLDRVRPGDVLPAAARFPAPPLRWITSATEEMQRRRDAKTWELFYVHGVQPSWHFARRAAGSESKGENAGDTATMKVPANLHGSIVHGVLERIREEAELSELLDETIGDLSTPELETVLAEGMPYRVALEQEIRSVIRSADWAWYVEGEHYRELSFLHLVGARNWRTGAFDLYRPDEPEAWIIDFKTHDVGAEQIETVARSYAVQAEFYRSAAAIRGPARVRLHFTRVNGVVDMD